MGVGLQLGGGRVGTWIAGDDCIGYIARGLVLGLIRVLPITSPWALILHAGIDWKEKKKVCVAWLVKILSRCRRTKILGTPKANFNYDKWKRACKCRFVLMESTCDYCWYERMALCCSCTLLSYIGSGNAMLMHMPTRLLAFYSNKTTGVYKVRLYLF